MVKEWIGMIDVDPEAVKGEEDKVREKNNVFIRSISCITPGKNTVIEKLIVYNEDGIAFTAEEEFQQKTNAEAGDHFKSNGDNASVKLNNSVNIAMEEWANNTNFGAIIKKKERKKNILICILGIGTLIAILVLGVSVFLDLGSVKYEEFSCAFSDKVCQELLCPIGWSWSLEDRKCNLKEGFQCCTDTVGMIQCQEKGRDMEDICVDLVEAGVGWSEDYKNTCRPGYIWVEWRQRCARMVGR